MRKFSLLFIILLFQISCYKHNNDLSFLNGEWSSDSLRSKKSDGWKEFLYFKNGKLLAHTTWWGKNYLINENQDIIKGQFQDKLGNIFKVKVIDSLNIKVIGKDYSANFIKESYQPENIISSLNEFKNSQIMREKLYGKYKIIGIKRRLKNTDFSENPFYKELLKSKEFDKIITIPAERIDFITIDNKRFSITTNDGIQHKFSYIINPQSIDLYNGDIIYPLKYQLSNNIFTLEIQDNIGICIDIIFKIKIYKH
ncbi:hypothetical protein [Chryseobacterium sp. Hurlbut01]|jgi:hypothetical protein|uniref:hypothetical protein n=1 Tax=Chryseobacterium sp. Hurlbut01 TaxID=1681828 RepID=UPI00067AF380|nr:hypothetical protein [Chryseobacterium sp. Hurlbut01]KNB60678.1 hypothetical protein AC804_16040 [Chryseobacterium sp. Hurlbut01]